MIRGYKGALLTGILTGIIAASVCLAAENVGSKESIVIWAIPYIYFPILIYLFLEGSNWKKFAIDLPMGYVIDIIYVLVGYVIVKMSSKWDDTFTFILLILLTSIVYIISSMIYLYV